MSQRVYIWQKALGEQLINDGYSRGCGCVRFAKLAASQYTHPQCIEEIRTDSVHSHQAVRALSIRRRFAVDFSHIVVARPPRAYTRPHQGYRLHAWEYTQFFTQILIEGDAFNKGMDILGIHSEDHQSIGPHSERNVLKVAQSADQQPSAD